jgi:sulfoxide reductase heme-binding subunit YedZ
MRQAMRAFLQKRLMSPWAKPLLMVLCALPIAQLFAAAAFSDLGPNPAEALIRQSGDVSIRALCYLLALTPLRLLSGMPALGRFRRILGLSVFADVCVHLLCYAWLDMGLEWTDITADIFKRPFIFVGFAGFLVLLALALTSTNSIIRWMGPKRWRQLHSLVYGVAALGVLHFYWMRASKHRFSEVIFYGSILAVLLMFRVLWAWKNKAPKSSAISADSKST